MSDQQGSSGAGNWELCAAKSLAGVQEGFPQGAWGEPAAARYTSPVALMPTAAPERTVTPVSVHSLLLEMSMPGVDMQPGPAHPEVPELLNACT